MEDNTINVFIPEHLMEAFKLYDDKELQEIIKKREKWVCSDTAEEATEKFKAFVAKEYNINLD